MDFDEWWSSVDGGYTGEMSARAAWDYQQQRIAELEAALKAIANLYKPGFTTAGNIARQALLPGRGDQ